MKTKLLAMMLLAGGSMFAQNRFSVGIGFGGGGGFNQAPPAYAYNIPPSPGPDYTWVDGYWTQGYDGETWVPGYWSRVPFFGGLAVAPRFEGRFRDDDRREFNRGFDADRNRSFEQGRNFSGQNRNQSRSFNQGQGRDSGQNQNQNQNRGNSNRVNGQSNRQGNDSSNGVRGR